MLAEIQQLYQPETAGDKPTDKRTENKFSPAPPSASNVGDRPAHFFKPGQSGNPGGRPKNVFDLQLRCKQEGAKVFEIILGWAMSNDFRASLPACRMILATGFAKFEKATEEMGTVPPGFENLSVAERIEVLKQRRAELKAAETGAAQAASQPVAKPAAHAVAATSLQVNVPCGTHAVTAAPIILCKAGDTQAGEKPEKRDCIISTSLKPSPHQSNDKNKNIIETKYNSEGKEIMYNQDGSVRKPMGRPRKK